MNTKSQLWENGCLNRNQITGGPDYFFTDGSVGKSGIQMAKEAEAQYINISPLISRAFEDSTFILVKNCTAGGWQSSIGFPFPFLGGPILYLRYFVT